MDRLGNYVRKFIILKSHYSNMKDLNQKGHGKLEARGQNVSISFNIKGAEATNYYDVLLIGRKKAHRLGSIYTEDKRNGYGEFNMQRKDLVASGFPLDKINGILISRNSNILLGGYFDKDDASIDSYLNSMDSSQKMEEVREEELYMEELSGEDLEKEILVDDGIPEEVSFLEEEGPMEEVSPGEEDILVEDSGPVEDEIMDQEYEEEDKADQDFQEEEYPEEDLPIEEVEEEEGLDQKYKYKLDMDQFLTSEEYGEALEDVFPQSQDMTEDYYEDFYMENELSNSNMTLDYILNILNYFPYIEPFRIKMRGYDWWKIDTGDPKIEKSFLPYFDYLLNRDYNNPMIEKGLSPSELIEIYGHYIFGLYENKDGIRFYIYGIPGLFKMEECPHGASAGFNTWFEGRDLPGYWLLYLEPQSGRIIYPINPMIPME